MEYKKIVKLLSAIIIGLLFNDSMHAAAASNQSENHATFMQRQRQALAQSQVVLAQHQADNPHLAPLAAQFLAQHAQTVQQLEQQILRQTHGDRPYTEHERLLARGQAHTRHSQSLMMPVLPKPTPASDEKSSVFYDSDDEKDNELFLPGASLLVKPATSRMPITPLIRPIPVRPAASAQSFGVTVHMAGIDPMGEDQNDQASLADYKQIYFRNMDQIPMEMRPMLSPDYGRIQAIQDYDKAFMISGWTREELETKSIEELTSVIMKYQQEVRRENPLFGDSEDDDSDEDVLPLAPATRMPAMERQVPGIALEVLERATAIPATATEAEEFVLVPGSDDDTDDDSDSDAAAAADDGDDDPDEEDEDDQDFAAKKIVARIPEKYKSQQNQKIYVNEIYEVFLSKPEYLDTKEAIEKEREKALNIISEQFRKQQ